GSVGVFVAAASSGWGSDVVGAGAVILMAVVVGRRVAAPAVPQRQREDGRHDTLGAATSTVRMATSGWLAVLALFGLMSAAQCLFVTFGPWLEDEFGVTTIGLVAVTFGIGVLELAASTTSAARTDRWGKERSVMLGAAIMVPAGLALGALEQSLVPGLLLLGAFIGAFEFAIVSAIPIGPTLIAGAPGRGLGRMIACGTLGRGVATIASTQLFEAFGLTATALLGAALAALAGIAMDARRRMVGA
ncbi:MAG: hypothetical protein ACR2HP_07245, partial [Ilumatobacteraceae bacterium]